MIAVDYYISAMVYMIGYNGGDITDEYISVAVYKDILIKFQVMYQLSS
jgi:hypothetical protein